MMMKILSTFLLLAILGGSNAKATLIIWGSHASFTPVSEEIVPDVYAANSNLVAATNGWLVQLMTLSGGITNPVSGPGSSDAAFSSGMDGVLQLALSDAFAAGLSGKTLCAIIYNAPTLENATKQAVFSSTYTVQTLKGDYSDPPNIDADLGHVAPEDWTPLAVPEPGTVVLTVLGLGLGLFGCRGRRAS